MLKWKKSDLQGNKEYTVKRNHTHKTNQPTNRITTLLREDSAYIKQEQETIRTLIRKSSWKLKLRKRVEEKVK